MLIFVSKIKKILKITSASILQSNHGIAPGFEPLRVILALVILVWHANGICHGFLAWEPTFLRPLRFALLPMFFALSGFLITGSALRVKSLKVFMTFRLLRILPALLVEVTMSAIILGGMVTTHSLTSYYTDKNFYAYFGNIIGCIKFTLPGVFEQHPVTLVNPNLRTLVPEFYCYAVIACLMLTGIFYRRKPYLYVSCAMGAIFFGLYSGSKVILPPGHLRSEALALSCMLGSLGFLYADYIPINKYLFLISSLVAYILLSFPQTTSLGLLPVAYCTIYLGMIKFPKIPLLSGGDYSYGIYLYGYPIEQMMWHYFSFARSPWGLILMAVPTTIIFAIFSWHCIEKRALKLKRFFLSKKPV